MNAHQLRCFVTVVDCGSVSKAADVLHMTQPPLSILIRKLEAHHDVTLFDRVSNRLIPTQAGLLLYRRAKDLLASMQAIHAELQECHHGLRGIVTVGCATAASLFIIPKIMQEIQDQGLDITVQVHEGSTDFVVQKLRDRTFDVGICRSEYTAPDLRTVSLYKEPLMLALPSGHPLLKRDQVRLADLRDERFLMHRSNTGPGISSRLIESCQLAGFSPNVVYWGIETLPLLLMVEMGLGIGFAPWSFSTLQGSGLPKFVPINDPSMETQLNLITPVANVPSPVTKRFLEITNVVIDSLDSDRKSREHAQES